MIRAYLDNASTTRLDPRVAAAMAPALEGLYGNPSSPHAAGRAARRAVEDARDRVAAALGFEAREIVFTGGATEADTLAIAGAARGRHVVVSAVEHAAVLEAARRWAAEVSVVPVDGLGRVDLGALEAALRPDTALVSLMTANNETGTIQPVEEAARLAHARGVPLHTDAAQACGKIPLPRGADLVTLSAHKMNGPKGAGALAVRRGVRLEPLQVGGPHEFGRRAGTENVAGILGLAAALELPPAPGLAGRLQRLQRLLREAVAELRFYGDPERRLPTILNVGVEGVGGEAMVIALDAAGVCAATGSACASGSAEPSHVLTAMGLSGRQVAESVRLSIGRDTTDEEIEIGAAELARAAGRLRAISPVWHE
jgi:cysteine desulfurase